MECNINKYFTPEEIKTVNEILLKVYEEGFDKVSENLKINPDYLGNARNAIDLLDKSIDAIRILLRQIKTIKTEIYINS